MNEPKLEKCIGCPVAHIFLKEYVNVKELKEKNNKSQYQEKIRPIVSCLSNLFSWEYDVLYDLLIKGVERDRIKTNVYIPYTEASFAKEHCLSQIYLITTKIDALLKDSNNPSEDLEYLDKTSIRILHEIENLLISNGVDFENERMNENEKKWNSNYKKELGIGKTHELSEEENNNAQDTYYKFQDILTCYCSNYKKVTEYPLCDSTYKNNSTFDNKVINKFVDCNHLTFFKIKQLGSDNVQGNVENVISKYSTSNQKILRMYLEQAPKNFKYILKKLREEQDLSETELARMLFKDGGEKSRIQGWCKNEQKVYIGNKANEIPTEKLARSLLVSEEVLHCGVGKIYGNWGIAIKAYNNIKYHKELLTHEDLNEISRIQYKQQQKPSEKVKDKVYEKINELINQSNEDFESMIFENPEFFLEEDYCVYFDEELGCYNYDLMYDNLINKDDFRALLSVLKKLENYNT